MDINTENLANHELNCSLKQDEVVVIMVPVPAQGHLNQLLQFTCLISSYSLRVYYVGLAAYNHKARVRANALNPSDIAKIHFHDLPSTPDFASSKSPTLFNACMLLREPIASFLRDISSKARRVVIVHDALMSYNVQDVSSFPNVESYIYHCISSFDMYCSYICEIARRLELPEGFEERVKGVGLVVREWATHPEILAHLSTGGFMSHCGWNSCLESITLGVPSSYWHSHSNALDARISTTMTHESTCRRMSQDFWLWCPISNH